MTSIASYSVGLTMDASSYIKNVGLSRKETGQLVRDINAARTPAENYQKSIASLGKALQMGAIDQGMYNRLLDSASSKFHAANSASKSYSSGLMGVATAAKAAGAAYIALRAVGFAKDAVVGSVKLAAEAQDAEISFGVLLKDANMAKRVMDDLRAYSATTPFQFPEVRQAGQQLIAFGFNAHNVMKELAMLGNIAAATGTPFAELTEVVGKARVENTIFAETLNQMAGRGINVIDPLAKRFGVLSSEVKKLASEGKVTFADLNAALTDLSASFGDMTGERGKSLSGMFSTLTDEVKLLAAEISGSLIPSLNEIQGFAINRTRDARSLGIGERLSVGFGAIGAMAGDVWGARGNPFQSGGMTTPGYLDAFLNERFNPKLMSRPDMDYKPDWFDPKAVADAVSAAEPKDFTASHNMEGLIGQTITSVGSMASTVLTGLSTFQDAAEMISMAGVAQTQELTKSLKEDPAVKNLAVGTQEAYEFLTQATREAEKATRLEAIRQRQLAENALEWQKKADQYLARIAQAQENNGFKRIR